MSAAKPESPRTQTASQRRCGKSSDLGAGFCDRFWARPVGRSSRRPLPTIHTAIAATQLAAIPTRVVPAIPSDGISTKPASSEPSAAPTVLTKYNALLCRAGSAASRAYQRIAIGNVAPSASAGTNTITRHDSTRTAGNSRPGAVTVRGSKNRLERAKLERKKQRKHHDGQLERDVDLQASPRRQARRDRAARAGANREPAEKRRHHGTCGRSRVSDVEREEARPTHLIDEPGKSGTRIGKQKQPLHS